MTEFQRRQFEYHGGFLHYTTDDGDRKFVARFKYTARDKPGFISFLIKHFTVEEYFGALDGGEAPAAVLRQKGYVSKTVRDLGTRRQQTSSMLT